MLLARREPELMQKHSIPRQQQWNKTKHDLSPPRTKWSPVLAPQTLAQRCAILWVVHLFRPRLLPNFSVHLCVTPGASPAPHAKLCSISTMKKLMLHTLEQLPLSLLSSGAGLGPESLSIMSSGILSNYCYPLNQNIRCWKINLRAWCWWQALKTTFCGHTHLSHLSSRHQVLSFQNLLCLDLFGCGRGIPNTVVSSTGGYQTNNCQTQCAKILLYQVTATNPENAKSAKEDSETVFCSYFLKTYLYYTPGNRDKKKI